MNVANILLMLLAAKVGIGSIKKYITRPNKLKMELKKYSNTDMVKVIELPDDIYLDEDKDNEVESNPVYQREYDDFCRTLISRVPRMYLDNFYRNFKTIVEKDSSIVYRLKNLLKRGAIVGGSYDTKENTIDLETMKLSKYMNAKKHELLHAASTYYDKKNGVIYCGLSQMYINEEDPKKNEVYGIGITEGVTQYYANKFYDPLHMLTPAYSVYKEEQIIAKALEKIVGETKLMSCYFKANLKGLVDELEQYTSREEVYKFINYTDVLMYYSRDKNLNFPELNDVKQFINMFLIKAYNNAQKKRGESVDTTWFGMRNTPYTIKSR